MFASHSGCLKPGTSPKLGLPDTGVLVEFEIVQGFPAFPQNSIPQVATFNATGVPVVVLGLNMIYVLNCILAFALIRLVPSTPGESIAP